MILKISLKRMVGVGKLTFKNLIFIVIPLLIIRCPSIQYKYYGLQVDKDSSGLLLGETEDEDLDLEATCYPKGLCVVLKQDEFFKLVRDYKEVRKRLDQCERR